MIDLECRLSPDHHDDAKFSSAIRACWLGIGGQAFQAYIVLTQAVDEALDQTSFASFEVSEEQFSALALDADDLSGFHPADFTMVKRG